MGNEDRNRNGRDSAVREVIVFSGAERIGRNYLQIIFFEESFYEIPQNKELQRMKECREEKKEVKIKRREMEMGRDEEVLCGEWARV